MLRLTRAALIGAVPLLLLAACGGDDDDDDAATDPVAEAQWRVEDARAELDDAQNTLDAAHGAFCDDSRRATSMRSTATARSSMRRR
jgi:hypothetical protein